MLQRSLVSLLSEQVKIIQFFYDHKIHGDVLQSFCHQLYYSKIKDLSDLALLRI